MNPEIINAIQAALAAQFEAGKVVGQLELLMRKALPEPPQEAKEE